MKKVNRFLALALCLICIASVMTSCKKDEELKKEEVTVENTYANGRVRVDSQSLFKLPCTRTDSFNPFYCTTSGNSVLMQLLFDGLFELDENFTAAGALADSFSADGANITVKLKSIKFSDGTVLSAQDVVYSFNKAKKAPNYTAPLSAFSSASGDGDTVVFKLAEVNILAHQLLTFPIVKAGTADDASSSPVGTGRFLLKSEKEAMYLKPNGYYDKNVVLTTIELVSVESSESIANALKIGNLSFAFNDLSSGAMMSSNSKNKSFVLNNMVYIGFNAASGITANPAFRRAVSYAVDRSEVAAVAYHGFAQAAVSPFNPKWPGSESMKITSDKTDTAAALQEINSINYKGSPVQILVNSENSFRTACAEAVARHLDAQGIKASVVAVPYEQYSAYLASGSYNMFIGEVKMTDDMNLNAFFKQGGSCAFSVDFNAVTSDENYNKYITGEADSGAFTISFKEEMPFVPLVYRKGVVSYTGRMKVKPTSYYGDLFDNVEQWTF